MNTYMTNHVSPSHQLERLHIAAASLDHLATSESNPLVAKALRRKAGAKRAAATRLARREGWQ